MKRIFFIGSAIITTSAALVAEQPGTTTPAIDRQPIPYVTILNDYRLSFEAAPTPDVRRWISVGPLVVDEGQTFNPPPPRVTAKKIKAKPRRHRRRRAR
jgi:hypothetical protein